MALVSAVLAPDLLLVETLLVFLAARSPLAEPLNLILVRWFLLSLFSVSLMIRWLHYRQKPRAVPIWVMLAGFATLALLSTAYSVEPALTFAKAGSFVILLIAAFCYAGMPTRFGEQSGRLLRAFEWTTVAVLVACIISPEYFGDSGFFRGPFGNPNTLGLIFAITGPIFVARATMSESAKAPQRAFAIIGCVAVIALLLASRSRGGIVALAFAVLWLLYFGRRKVFWVATALFAILTSSLLLVSPQTSTEIHQGFVLKGSSSLMESRESSIEASVRGAKAGGWLGLGFGVSLEADPWTGGFSSGTATREKTNSYLGLMEEVGIVGTILIAYPILRILVATTFYLSRRRRQGALKGPDLSMAVLTACIIGGALNASVEAWLTAAGSFSTIMFWMGLAVMANELCLAQEVFPGQGQSATWPAKQRIAQGRCRAGCREGGRNSAPGGTTFGNGKLTGPKHAKQSV